MLQHKLNNPEFLLAIWGQEEPSLSKVELSTITIEGITFEVGFYPKNFPSNPPVKWKKNKYNALLIKLALSQLSDIEVKGVWEGPMEADIVIDRINGGLKLSILSDHFNLNAKGWFLQITHQDAYIDERFLNGEK